MNTDSYSDFIPENKINIAVNRVLALGECPPDKSVCKCYITNILHDLFCPCLLSGCPACRRETTDKQPSSVMENALITEITARVHHARNSDIPHT